MTPKEVYVNSRKAGYTKEEAASRAREFSQTGKVPEDPTEAYWQSLVNRESRGNQKAVSNKGAVGAAQVMPKTAPEAAKLAGLDFNEQAWREDQVYNEAIGRAYFRKQFKDFGTPHLAAAAYNAGPGAVRKAGGDISKLPKETQAYVPAVMGDKKMTPREQFIQLRQQGYSKEEAAAMVRGQQPQAAAPQQPAAQPQQQAPAPAPVQPPSPAPSAAPQPPQAPPQPTELGYSMNEDLRGMLQGNGLERFLAGVGRTAADVTTGARQIYNTATGDDETLARLQEESRQREAIFNKQNPEGSGLSAVDVGNFVGDVGAFGSMGGSKLAGQMAAGGLEGALKPADSTMERAGNTATGAAMGAIGPAISGMKTMWNRLSPQEAAKDFTARALKQAPGAPIQDAYEEVAGKVTKGADDAYEAYRGALQGAERSANPKVKLTNTAKLQDEVMSLEDEVVQALTPKTAKALGAVSKAATKTSPIVDETGKNFTSLSEIDFEDARGAARELKALERQFNKANKPGAVGQIKRIRSYLEKDMEEWAGLGADTAQSLVDARKADSDYATDVLPAKKLADSLKAPNGKSQESKIDSYLFGGINSTANAGSEVKKLLEVAPDSKEGMRRILGSKINTPRGEIASARSYMGGTTAEALLTKEEREYLVKLANSLQDNPSFMAVKFPMLDKIIRKTTGSGAALPYGYESLMQGPMSKKLINALRSGAIGTEEE